MSLTIYKPKNIRYYDTSGLTLVGQGANGKVYRFDEDKIIKVGIRSQSLDDILHEQALARKAFVLGLPTAIPFSVVDTSEGYGSAFELLGSQNLAQYILSGGDDEKLRSAAALYSDLLKTIHAAEGSPDWCPDAKSKFVAYLLDIKSILPEKAYDSTGRIISSIPDSSHLVHGDLNPRNVMVVDGQLMIIDLETLSLGDPVFDYAALWASCIGFGAISARVDQINGLPEEKRTAFWDLVAGLSGDMMHRIYTVSPVLGSIRILRWVLRHDGRPDIVAKAMEVLLSHVRTLCD